jgi:hypothetical protein
VLPTGRNFRLITQNKPPGNAKQTINVKSLNNKERHFWRIFLYIAEKVSSGRWFLYFPQAEISNDKWEKP